MPLNQQSGSDQKGLKAIGPPFDVNKLKSKGIAGITPYPMQFG